MLTYPPDCLESADYSEDGKQSGRISITRHGDYDVVSNIFTDSSDDLDSDGGVSLGT